MHRFTLDSIGKIAFGEDLRTLEKTYVVGRTVVDVLATHMILYLQCHVRG
jgi:hypothetical protein